MKKTVWLLLALVLVCMLLFTACGEEDPTPDPNETPGTQETPDDTEVEQPHVHAFGEWITLSEANCSAQGVQARICGCGEQETQEIAALAHTEVADAAVAATCTTDGKTEGKHCSVCGVTTVEQTIVKALGHTEVVDTAVAATCTTDGKTEGKHCSVCGVTTVEQTIVKALGHTEVVDTAITATCTTDGKTEGKHCSVCGVTIVEQKTIAARGHSPYIYEFGYESCGYEGRTRGEKCNNCGEILLESKIIPATGEHTPVVIEKGEEPTCTRSGYTDFVICSYCKRILHENEYLPALGHSYDEYVSTHSTHEGICTVCGESAREAHVFAEGTTNCTVCLCSVEMPDADYKETPPDFAEGYITTEITYIETEYVLYQIDANIFVIGDLVEKTDEMCREIEAFTGLSFKNPTYGGKKILVLVNRRPFSREDVEMEPSTACASASSGDRRSDRGDECIHRVYLAPGDLFLSHNEYYLHEMLHVLRFCQADVDACTFKRLPEEGFAQYFTEKIAKYLVGKGSPLAYALDCHHASLFAGMLNTEYENYDHIYDHPMEYWVEYAQKTDNYAFGTRFMTYLQDVYGDCTAWTHWDPERPRTENVINVFLQCYGSDCLDGFYPWLRENEDRFIGSREGDRGSSSPHSQKTIDLTWLQRAVVYPYYSFFLNSTDMGNYSFTYNDLYLDIEDVVRYLRDYKGENVDDLTLVLSDAVLTYVFDRDGSLLRATYDKQISLEGVSYVKLVGSGYMGCLEIVGYFPEAKLISEEITLFTGTAMSHQYHMSYSNTFPESPNPEDLSSYYQLLFRDDVTVILRLSVPCSVTLRGLDWNEVEYRGITEIVLDGCRDWYAYCTDAESFDIEVIAIPTN